MRTISLTANATTSVYVDLDGDSRRDFAGIGLHALITRFVDGSGTMGEPSIHPLPGLASGLVVGDLDDDGRTDVATALSDLGTVAWLRGGDPTIRSLAIGPAIRSLAVGDLNGDRITDLLAGERDEGGLHVLLGGPDGPRHHQRIDVDDVGDIAVGELGDGEIVVAVASPARGVVELLAASREGSLTPRERFWDTSFPVAVVFSDLDDDGVMDLAAADQIERRIRVAHGEGMGGWRDVATWSVPLAPLAMTARRGPHGPELALVGTDTVSVALVDPMAGKARLRATTRANLRSLAAVDLDDDGIDELTSGEAILREIEGFTAEVVWRSDGGSEGHMVRADVDGDGTAELIVQDPTRNELMLLAVSGEGLVEAARVPVLADLDGIAALPLDGGKQGILYWRSVELHTVVPAANGFTDRVVDWSFAPIVDIAADPKHVYVVSASSPTSQFIQLDWTAGELSFAATVIQPNKIFGIELADPGELWIADARGVSRREGDNTVAISPLRELVGATSVDIDADGRRDLVGCRDGEVLAASGADGRLIRLGLAECDRIEACDLDGDGLPELLASQSATSVPPRIELLGRSAGEWRSRGSLGLGAGADRFVVDCDDLSIWTGSKLGLAHLRLTRGPALRETGSRHRPQVPTLGDVDGDGLDDLLADDGTEVLLARGQARRHADPHALRRPSPAQFVAIAELDGEPGHELLARVSPPDSAPSHEIWSLREAALIRTGELALPDLEMIADFDGDRLDELVVRDENGVRSLVNTDIQGGFTSLVLDPDPLAEASTFRAADLDRDGRADILASMSAADRRAVHVLRSRGDGSFAGPQAWPLSVDPRDLGIGDIDRDGAFDLIAPKFARLSICRGDGRGGPAGACRDIPWNVAVSSRPAVGDYDGDGSTDIVAAYNEYGDGRPHLQVLRGDGFGGFVVLPPRPIPMVGAIRPALAGEGATWLVLTSGRATELAAGEP